MFRSAKLGEWVALATLVGIIALFLVKSNSNAAAAVVGVGKNKANIEVISEKVEAMGDSMLVLTLNNRSEHKAMNKVGNDTYELVKLMAKQQGIVVP